MYDEPCQPHIPRRAEHRLAEDLRHRAALAEAAATVVSWGHVAHSARQSHGHTFCMSKKSDWGFRVTHVINGWLAGLHTSM